MIDLSTGLCLLFLGACARSEYELVAVDGVATTDLTSEIELEPADEWEPVLEHDGSAVRVVQSGDDRDETFIIGDDVPTAIADYLFVVDDSVSMHVVIDRVRAGFASLGDGNDFPRNARIGVMNMIPGTTGRLGRPHAAVQAYRGMRRHPGFLRLVDAAGLVAFRQATLEEVAARLSEPGCDKWFEPGEVNANGTPCIVAHTQLSSTPIRAEAGLVAVRQLLGVERVFRPGAAVNLIFVSDTHDPGFQPPPGSELYGAFQDLLALQPDYQELEELARSKEELASFRVHAIAPMSACSNEDHDQLPPVYFQVAEDSGGVVADLCTLDDYSGVIRRIARTGANLDTPVLVLSEPVSRVEAVRMGAVDVVWGLDASRRVITLTGMPERATQLTVRYVRSDEEPEPAPGRRSSAPRGGLTPREKGPRPR